MTAPASRRRTRPSPAEAPERGIALIRQEIRLLPEPTVAENIFLGRLPVNGGRIDRAREAGAVREALGMAVAPQRRVAGLSTAVQRGIGIAGAIIRRLAA